MNRNKWSHASAISRLIGATGDQLLEAMQKKKKALDGAKLVYTQCRTCERASSGYFEGILQIRKKGYSSYDEAVEFAFNQVDANPDCFISRVIELKEGVDLYMSSHKLIAQVARKMQSAFGGELVFSKKLFSKVKDKELYRITVLVRLPHFSKGEVIEHEGKPLYVKSIIADLVNTVNLETGGSTKLKYNQDIEVIGKGKKMQVVKRKPVLEVLDDDFQARAVENNGTVNGEYALVVSFGGRLFLLPNQP